MNSLLEIAEWLGFIESSLPVPQDEKTVDDYADILRYSKYKDDALTDILVSAWARIQKLRLATKPRDRSFVAKFIENLCGQKQTAQRTLAWYEQGKSILTASEIYSLFRSARVRAQMVFSKVEKQYRMSQPLAVRSEKMSPFDWGIRFEPVVKQIFELSCCLPNKASCKIEELGRILHPTDERVAASPDGLIVDGPDELLGHLIEIKAPVSREIDHGIPVEYYAQMQTQLEVTRARGCQYIEMKFASPYNSVPITAGPALYSGYIYIINIVGIPTDYDLFPEDRLEYVYGNVNSEEVPADASKGIIIERIPWRCMGWYHETVMRREDWWLSIQPAIKQFWLDVEGARAGTFTIPDSTRKPKKIISEVADTLHEQIPAVFQNTNQDIHADNCLPSEHNLTSCGNLENFRHNSSENQLL